MKTFKYILVLCIMVTAMACDRSDDSNFDVYITGKRSRFYIKFPNCRT